MSHIPNPFDGNGSPHFASAITPPVPSSPNRGFLLMTRPPSHNYRSARSFSPHHNPNFEHTPFRNQRRNNRSYGGHYGNFSPYRHSQNFVRKPFGGSARKSEGFHSRRSFQACPNNKGPLSEIPIEKFISISMIKDPWENFETDETANCTSVDLNRDPKNVSSSLMENSELVDSDIGETDISQPSDTMTDEGGVSPSREDLFKVLTPSTSEKDTGSDTASDG